MSSQERHIGITRQIKHRVGELDNVSIPHGRYIIEIAKYLPLEGRGTSKCTGVFANTMDDMKPVIARCISPDEDSNPTNGDGLEILQNRFEDPEPLGGVRGAPPVVSNGIEGRPGANPASARWVTIMVAEVLGVGSNHGGGHIVS